MWKSSASSSSRLCYSVAVVMRLSISFVGLKAIQSPFPFTHCAAKREPFMVSVMSLFLVFVFMRFTLLKTLSQSALECGKHSASNANCERQANSFSPVGLFHFFNFPQKVSGWSLLLISTGILTSGNLHHSSSKTCSFSVCFSGMTLGRTPIKRIIHRWVG